MNIIPLKKQLKIHCISILKEAIQTIKIVSKNSDRTFISSFNQFEMQNDRIVLVYDKILLV